MVGSVRSHLVWVLIGLLGAFALALIAVERGEHVNALWIVVAAIATYLITCRYYSLFIARRVMQLDPECETPAVRHNDGLDYVPTNRYVLFGRHFAAIIGAGPLVSLVLAAQMGYHRQIAFRSRFPRCSAAPLQSGHSPCGVHCLGPHMPSAGHA